MDESDPPPEPKRPRRIRKKPYSPHYRANNDGGNGNPPVKTQFQVGNPGGPGRPKGKTNLESSIKKAMSKKLVVNKNGKSVKMEPVEIFAERLLEAVLSKSVSPAMLEFGRQLFEKYGPQVVKPDPEQAVLNERIFGAESDDRELFLAFLNRFTGCAPAYPEPSIFGPAYDPLPMEGPYLVSRLPDGHITVRRSNLAEEFEAGAGI